MLKSGINVIAGHNLDKGKHAHGTVFINKRGINKQGKSWTELAYNKSVPNPKIEWTSKYGSVTFNRFCRDFPDGGMNEAGLFIEEMSLAGTSWPVDDSKPKIFMCLWMQYALDNFESIEQVVQSAHDFSIEGWSWHFFTADSNGNAAVIEFLDEKVVIYKGDDLPIPVLANTKYEKELEMIKEYEGFGGTKEIDLESLEKIYKFSLIDLKYKIKRSKSAEIKKQESVKNNLIKFYQKNKNESTETNIIIPSQLVMDLIKINEFHIRDVLGKQKKYFKEQVSKLKSEVRVAIEGYREGWWSQPPTI